MTYKGTVRNGVVVLEERVRLPEGTSVEVLPPKKAKKRFGKRAVAKNEEKKGLSRLAKMLLRHAGTAKGLPSDMARNHDHYIHGTPKK